MVCKKLSLYTHYNGNTLDNTTDYYENRLMSLEDSYWYVKNVIRNFKLQVDRYLPHIGST